MKLSVIHRCSCRFNFGLPDFLKQTDFFVGRPSSLKIRGLAHGRYFYNLQRTIQSISETVACCESDLFVRFFLIHFLIVQRFKKLVYYFKSRSQPTAKWFNSFWSVNDWNWCFQTRWMYHAGRSRQHDFYHSFYNIYADSY